MRVEPGVIAIIPARWGSTRFPGKPLAQIAHKPMIQWVVEGIRKARSVSEVIVATDDQRIYDAVRDFGGRAKMTSPEHFSGSDRVAEVAAMEKCDIVVNVQGDEPLISPENLDLVVHSLVAEPSLKVSTLKTKICLSEDLMDSNIVKVVTDVRGMALYFSRAPIPFDRDNINHERAGAFQWSSHHSPTNAFKHIGIYAYTRSFLLEFTKCQKSPLEEIEKLEQLRILEMGVSIKVVETEQDSIGVDVPDDILKVERVLSEMKRN